MWDATMAENRIIKLGKRQILSVTKWSTSSVHTLTVTTVQVLPFFTLFITGIFAKQAKRNLFSLQLMFGVSQKDGKTDKELAKAGVEALADFIKEIGMPTTFKELGIDENINLKEIADSCGIVPGAYKR